MSPPPESDDQWIDSIPDSVRDQILADLLKREET